MNEPLQLNIERDGIVICHQLADRETKLALNDEVSLGEQLAEYSITRGMQGNTLLIFVSEDLLFYKTILLPLNTQDLKEAISYQLGMLVPFEEEDLLYSFSSVRGENGYAVTLAATSKQRIEPYLEELVEADFQIAGLYPAFQRYVTRNGPKGKWALVMPGRSALVLLFNGQHIVERMIITAEQEFEALAVRCDTEEIYHLQPPADSRYLHARKLLTGRPSLKEFNLLPATYRRPEYSKFLIILLLALNLLALVAFIGGKEHQLGSYAARVDGEIEKMAPLVREVRELHSKEAQLNRYLDEFAELGQNPDLIPFMENLTRDLPESAYLDQMRMDSKNKAVTVQGYTDDINALTAKLQEMGDAKLKSTSRRKNQTYFNVEISLP